MSTPHGEHRKSDNPLVQLMVSMSGASAPEHETDPPGVEPVSLRAGHEPDQFQIKGILYVPVFVAVAVALTYVVVTMLFNSIYQPNRPTPGADPRLAEKNAAPMNDRFARIDSRAPKADLPGDGVPQPRLEYLRQTNENTDPAYYRSKQPAADGNPPELRPESLRPENYVEPRTKTKILIESADLGNGRHRVAIADAIKFATEQKRDEKDRWLPVSKKPVKLPETSSDLGKSSNSGRVRGMPVGAAALAPGELEKGHKHDDHDHKKDESKKDAPKADEKDIKKDEPKKDGK